MRTLVLLWMGLLSLEAFSAGAEFNVQKILESSDRSRGGVKDGLEWTIQIESTEEGETNQREFFVKNKGDDSYVESRAPQKFKGEVFLFNGRTIWYFKPGLRKPLAISARQKLTGVASNGDIAATNYSRDYQATLTQAETFNKEPCYRLHLKSKVDDTTYDQINYWVSKKSGLALKAEFLSLSGKPLKVATFQYGNKIQLDQEEYPFISEMRIIDSTNIKNQSKLTFAKPIIKKHPDSLFNVNNLLR